MQVLPIDSVPGDVDAIARLVVTDNASQSRRFVAWGMESRWLATSSPPSLIIDSTSMVTSGFSGVTATRSGAYSGASNNVIRATLRTQAQAVCGLGNLSHVGDFRPQLRFYASATTMAVRLTWQALDGPFRSLSYTVPVTAGWNHVDLGHIAIPPAVWGTQKWTGRVEAYSTATGGETLDVDVLYMLPAERTGKAIGSYAYQPGALVAYDDFTGLGVGVALNGRTPSVGSAWSTTGATTDLVGATDPSDEDYTVVSRATTSDTGPGRHATIPTNYTDTEVGCRFMRSVDSVSIRQGVIARWVDASNLLAAYVVREDPEGLQIVVAKVIAGALVPIAERSIPSGIELSEWYRIHLVAYASGRYVARLLTGDSALIAQVEGTDTVLQTGGALATGRPGMIDYNGSATASTRTYDDFIIATPAPEPIVCYSGQSIEFRSDTTLRQDSTGTYAGQPPEDVGGRVFVPPAGGEGREARFAVIARRGEIGSTADDNIADSTTVQAWVTPRYLAVPRG
jgi:hypothetical protein